MGNEADYYVVMSSHRYEVELEGTVVGFSKITNIQNAVEYETIVEGGNNRYAHTLVKPYSQAQTITFERGITLRSDDKQDYLKLNPGYVLKKPITISVFTPGVVQGNARSSPLLKSYTLSGGMVTKWELGALDAMSNEVLIERLEIAHSGIVENRD